MKKFIARICLRIWLLFTGLKFYKKDIVPTDPPYDTIRVKLSNSQELLFDVYCKTYENVIFGFFNIKHKNYKAFIIRCDFSVLGSHDLQKFSDLSFVLLSQHAEMFDEDMVIEILMAKYLLYLEHALKQDQ